MMRLFGLLLVLSFVQLSSAQELAPRYGYGSPVYGAPVYGAPIIESAVSEAPIQDAHTYAEYLYEAPSSRDVPIVDQPFNDASVSRVGYDAPLSDGQPRVREKQTTGHLWHEPTS